MAKLKGPLFSFGATGKIADALVYFAWKGLNVVREYVVPTNPKSDKQIVQRDYLKAAVAAVHAAQIFTDHELVKLDTIAYALWGSIWATPRTWFNTICKNWIDQYVAGLKGAVFGGAEVQEGDTIMTLIVYGPLLDGIQIIAGKVYYGTSKSALLSSVDATIAPELNRAVGAITGLSNKVKYYMQFRPTESYIYKGAYSGIYTGIPKAA